MHVQGARWFGPLFDRWIALVVHTSVQVPVEDASEVPVGWVFLTLIYPCFLKPPETLPNLARTSSAAH
jgi:hypothetical protein